MARDAARDPLDAADAASAEPDDDFWTVFHASRTPMLLFDDGRRYRDLNRAACECFGRSRADILRHRLGDRTAADLSRRLDEVFPGFLARGHLTLDWAIILPGGRRREVFLQAFARVAGDLHLLVFLAAPPSSDVGGLTPREREITALLAQGCDGAEIARRLILSPETVRTHVRNAMERAGARTRAQLIAIALRERLIDP